MCFSEEASFMAGAILTVIGAILVAKFYKRKEILLALIPLFFAIQQFAEGMLWVALEKNKQNLFALYVFLFITELFWPVWVPLAFGIVEKVRWRRNAMWGLMTAGLLFSSAAAYYLVNEGVKAKIIEHSISYGSSPLSYKILYGLITLVPFFLSSIPRMWILASAYTLAFVVADIFYDYAFVSVWCAFSAILAIGFLILLKKE